jgi:hypothetical protein
MRRFASLRTGTGPTCRRPRFVALERAGLREGIVLGLMASGQLLGALLMHKAP